VIDLKAYWMGRNVTHAKELTPAIEAEAAKTVGRVRTLLEIAARNGVQTRFNTRTGSLVSRGWRPPTLNAATPGAAPKSKHMTGEAVDIYDPHGELGRWCLDHLHVLEACALYLEHPDATPTWCHLQTAAPRSGNQVFKP
jgi:hypothetical protein